MEEDCAIAWQAVNAADVCTWTEACSVHASDVAKRVRVAVNRQALPTTVGGSLS
jgi:hypothetical protein